MSTSKITTLLSRQTRRVFEAALLSLGVYMGTLYWYKSTSLQVDLYQDVRPVAYVSSIHEDVRRRPASRLIWQMLNSGEPLYPGEAIKTSAKGDVRIQFADSPRYIDLDPDSLIVINQNKNEISLDLMDGSLLVAGGNTGEKGATKGPSLTLKSAQGKVDLSQATASLSKSETGKVEVQVLKGKVKNENGQELKSDIQVIKLLTPKIDQPTVINPENVEPIKFSWAGAPPNTDISLWLGPTRKELKPIAEAKPDPKDGKLSFLEKKLPIGKHFYKLVASAFSSKKIIAQSEIYRLEILAKYPPGAIFPANEANLVMNKTSNPVDFKWSNPNNFQNISLEISKDPSFRNIIHSKNFSADDDSFIGSAQGSYTYNLSPGEYYWRLSSAYDGIEGRVFAKPLKFSITATPKEEIKISLLPQAAEKSKQYFINKPELKLTWDTTQKRAIKKWKVQVWPAAQGRSPSNIVEKISDLESLEMIVEVPSQGLYTAVLEAYNEYGTLVAKSNPKTVELAPLPILKAPQFMPEHGNLISDRKGDLDLHWTKLVDAKEYHLILLDKEGKEIKRGKFSNNATKLVNLLPGEYQIDVYAVDTYGRISERTPPRSVTVPKTGATKAPKLKKVKVN